MNGFIGASKPFEAFGKKAERYLEGRFPSIVNSGGVNAIHIGRNRDASPGQRGGFRVTGAASQVGGQYLEVPDKILGLERIKNKDDAGVETFSNRVTDSMRQMILDAKQSLLDDGVAPVEVEKRVKDSLNLIAYYDGKIQKYVTEPAPVKGRIRDSLLSGLSVPYWDVSYTTKVFKQPFIQGIAKNLVDTMGVPNIWADALVMYAETFEGFARLGDVAKGNGEFNNTAPVRNRMDMLVSEFVNLVVDYETGFHESIVAAQPGNFLTPMAIGDRERYARLMLEQLSNALILFGASEAGFEGLSQVTSEDTYSGTPLNDIWDGTSATKGALVVNEILKTIGDMQEALSFLPSSVRINVSPSAYKVLKWVMMSDVYNSRNPIRVIQDDFQAGNEQLIQSNGFGTGIEDFRLVSDPFCAPNTPWNDDDTDLMFITFPTIKSALDPQEGVVIAPTAIENFVLPAYPQRDGLCRTMLKRIGSIIAPIDGTVKIIRGFGYQGS